MRDRKMDMSGRGGMDNHERQLVFCFVFSFAELTSMTFWPDMIKIILIVADLKFRYNSLLFWDFSLRDKMHCDWLLSFNDTNQCTRTEI